MERSEQSISTEHNTANYKEHLTHQWTWSELQSDYPVMLSYVEETCHHTVGIGCHQELSVEACLPLMVSFLFQKTVWAWS